ncbi:hypothetical protein CHARACLAT_020381 [Characodon lateralis]|uniref:Uncharacterized protein n=1 Tax=Characodon lateralis TaxID=208331 RepID=A0ABU7F4J3_9TELE|nr:hypothetical protein [Characodon lateralis]
MMKVYFVLPLSLLTSVILVGFMKIRKKEYEKEVRRDRFQDIKMRVTSDVFQEYQNEKAEKQNELEKAQAELKAMENEITVVLTKTQKTTEDLTGCDVSQKSGADQVAASETTLKNLKAETNKETTEWNGEIDRLKEQLKGKSLVCNFLKEQPDPIKSMCGIKDVPKVEAPKQEEPKAEAPKQEQPKAEAPKQEEPKAEAPKQEQPKAEAPKQEQPKAEAPKQEQPKAEAPKQEEKKAEAPKQ